MGGWCPNGGERTATFRLNAGAPDQRRSAWIGGLLTVSRRMASPRSRGKCGGPETVGRQF